MSTGDLPHLTAAEVERNNQFLQTFATIEGVLQDRLRVPRTTSVSRLIRDYRGRNAYWQEDADDLIHYAQIRNFLTHEQDEDNGHPVAVSPRSLACLRAILHRLQTPRSIGEWYRHPPRSAVLSVTSILRLDDVLRLAYRRRFSQFPVVDDAVFRGVITENAITRWLGRQLLDGRNQFGFSSVTVEQVMSEQEPGSEAIFEFRRVDDGEEEVMASFHQRPNLEVVLLTESGDRNTPIGGIITQWDAARYPDATPE